MDTTISNYLSRFREANQLAEDYPFEALQSFIATLILGPELDRKASKEICELLLDIHTDIWYHGLGLLRNICVVAGCERNRIAGRDTHLMRIARLMEENKITSDVAIARLFMILEKVRRPGPQLYEQDPILSCFGEKKASVYRIQFKKCWAEFLRCCGGSMNRELLVKILRTIPDSVMPHIQNPEIFASFFTDCFERDDDLEVSLLSVSGLFHLISRHNLGEPADLYSRLYQLIRPETMKKSSYSNRVFQLLVKAIRSPLMPSQLVPVFAKRLLRVAVLVKSPSMTLWLLVAAFNLMQAHPLVSKPLIHREDTDSLLSTDAFDLDSRDVNAMSDCVGKSSLWELELLLNHNDPSVVRIAQMFRTNFFSRKAKRISSDDYLLITDEQLFNRERKYGSHSKAKRAKGEMELDNIAGDDSVKKDLLLPLAVPTEGADLTIEPFLVEFQKTYGRI
jgi:hypothetical protein